MTDWFGAEEHVDRALELFQRGRWAEAEAELRKALAVSPDRGEWQFNLGLTLEAAGRDREALVCFERAAELMPEQVEPLLAAGQVCNRLGEHERAVQILEVAVRSESANDHAFACLIESLSLLDRHDDAETNFYLAQQRFEEIPRSLAAVAESLIETERWEKAGWCLREALRLEPTMPRVRARLAAVLAATGKPERAVQMYWRELRESPGSVPTLLDFGDLLVSMNRLPEAAEKYRRVLELEPANVEAHARLGELAMRSGSHERAQVEFELVTKLDPEYPGMRLCLAEALVERGRLDEARRSLLAELDAVAGDEWDGDLARLGALLLRVDEPGRAATVLQRAIDEDGANGGAEVAETWRKLALARFQCGDRAGGAAASRHVLRIEPQCVGSLHNLALSSLEENRLARAAAFIRRGLRIDPHDEGLRRLRSRLLLARLAARWRRVPRR